MSEEINEVLDRLGEVGEPDKQARIADVAGELEPEQLALLLEALPVDERLQRWYEIPADMQQDVFVAMRAEVRGSILRALSEDAIDRLLTGLDAQDLIELADSLPDELVEDALSRMDSRQRAFFERAAQFGEDQIGRYVDHELLMLPANARVQDADRLLRREYPEYTDAIFLYDRTGHYRGAVRVSDLHRLPGHLPLANHVDEEIEPLRGDMELDDAAEAVMHSGLAALPVVDEGEHLLGRVTLRDAMEIQRELLEGQLMAQAGLNEDDDLFAPVVRSSVRRATWLGINLLTALLASWTIGLFEATLQQVVALAVLMPVVASMGGIAGSQTLALIIRGMALDQISRSNIRSLLRKELGVAGVNGVVWALVIALIAVFWFSDTMLGVVIAVAIIVNILAAAFSGVAIPLLLERMKIDPAISGSVILTTVTDVVGFFTFLGLGTLLL